MKKFFNLVLNLVGCVAIILLVTQTIPTMVSSPNDVSVAIGLLLSVICIASVWCIFEPVVNKLINEVKK